MRTFIENLFIRYRGQEKRAELFKHWNFNIPVVISGGIWFQVKGKLKPKFSVKPVDADDRIYFRVCEDGEECGYKYILSDEAIEGATSYKIVQYPDGTYGYLCSVRELQLEEEDENEEEKQEQR